MIHISAPATKVVIDTIRKAPKEVRKSRLDIVLQAKMITPEQHAALEKELCCG